MKEIIGKLDFTKTKIFCSVKDTVKGLRRETIDWEKIFGKDRPDKGLLSKTHKELKLNNNKTTRLKMGQRGYTNSK